MKVQQILFCHFYQWMTEIESKEQSIKNTNSIQKIEMFQTNSKNFLLALESWFYKYYNFLELSTDKKWIDSIASARVERFFGYIEIR